MAMFSSTVENSLPFFEALLKAKGRSHSQLTGHLLYHKRLLNALTEITHNLLKNQIPISKLYKRQLQKSESHLKLLATKGELTRKRHLLSNQKGKALLKLLLKATVRILKKHGSSIKQ